MRDHHSVKATAVDLSRERRCEAGNVPHSELEPSAGPVPFAQAIWDVVNARTEPACTEGRFGGSYMITGMTSGIGMSKCFTLLASSAVVGSDAGETMRCAATRARRVTDTHVGQARNGFTFVLKMNSDRSSRFRLTAHASARFCRTT